MDNQILWMNQILTMTKSAHENILNHIEDLKIMLSASDFITKETVQGHLSSIREQLITSIEEKEPELKPCPFCGCYKINFYRNGNSHYAYCDNCGGSSRDNAVKTSREKVIEQWNRRV